MKYGLQEIGLIKKNKSINMLFTKEFLEEIQDKVGAKTMLDYFESKGMSFHDAVLRLAKFHDIEPQYVYPGYSHSDKSINLWIDTLKKNMNENTVEGEK